MAITVILMVTILIIFCDRLYHTITAGVVDNIVLGADPAARFRALADARYWRMGYELHPLACVWTLITVGPLRLLGVAPSTAAAFSLGLAVAVGGGAILGSLRLVDVSRAGAVAIVALVMSSFAVLTGFSVIDTYAVSFAAVSGALLAVLVIAQRWPLLPRRAVLAAGIALSIPVAANLPTATYALLFAGIVWDRAKQIRPTILAGGGAAAIAAAAAVSWLAVTRFILHFDSAHVMSSYASWSHFARRELGDGVASLFAFGLVAPPGPLHCRYLTEALVSYDGWRAALLGGWWLLIAAGVVQSVRDRAHRGLMLAALVAAAGMLLFYLYFAPQVMLLYTPQFMPVLALMLAGLVRRYPRIWLALGALTIGTVSINAPSLWSIDLTNFQASCPAMLQVNGSL